MRAVRGNRFHHILPEENLIHFRREIVIHNKRLRDVHTRLDTISDLIRFKLDPILQNMDDPSKAVPTFAGDEPRTISGVRVYHINLIVHLSGESTGDSRWSRYRLVVSRNGLVRIEPIVVRKD
jgi:hypothetical protein